MDYYNYLNKIEKMITKKKPTLLKLAFLTKIYIVFYDKMSLILFKASLI